MSHGRALVSRYPCLLCIFIFAFGGVAAASPAAPPIRIGALLHLTGEFSVQGKAFREGMELGADSLRREGDEAVEILFEDTQYSALRSVTAAKKLLSSDHVDAAVISTAVEAKAAGPEFQRGNMPAVVLWDSSPELEAIGRFIFAIGPWIPASGERIAGFAAHSLRAKTAAIINTNTEWSAAVADAFQKSFEGAGGTIVSRANENPTETDFRTTLLRAKRKSPDVIYAPVDANLIAFFNQVKQLQIEAPILTSDIITEDNLQEDPKAFEGVYQSAPLVGERKEAQDLFRRYEEKFRHPCSQVLFVAWGFDAVRLIADAYRRAGGKTGGAALQEQLLGTKEFQGASNVITMNAKGSAPTPLTIFRVQGGKFEAVREVQ